MSQAKAKPRKLPFFKRLARDISRHPALYVIFIVIMTYFVLFCYWPMYGNIIAFQKYKPLKGILGSKFVGFTNFEKFFNKAAALMEKNGVEFIVTSSILPEDLSEELKKYL